MSALYFAIHIFLKSKTKKQKFLYRVCLFVLFFMLFGCPFVLPCKQRTLRAAVTLIETHDLLLTASLHHQARTPHLVPLPLFCLSHYLSLACFPVFVDALFSLKKAMKCLYWWSEVHHVMKFSCKFDGDRLLSYSCVDLCPFRAYYFCLFNSKWEYVEYCGRLMSGYRCVPSWESHLHPPFLSPSIEVLVQNIGQCHDDTKCKHNTDYEH